MSNAEPVITVSVVSHRQNALVNQLVEDLDRYSRHHVRLVITENVADDERLSVERFGGQTQVIANRKVAGFGANHNAAFERCTTPFFCVTNPDIRLTSDPFPPMMHAFAADIRVAAMGPAVRSPAGTLEDSARRFPTIASLLRKAVSDRSGPDYPNDKGPVEVDWIAGMFMLFRSDAFRRIGGFDERYFLYYEDVDICRRLRSSGAAIVFDPGAQVIHDARRASRRNLRLALHHARSAARFLFRVH